MRPFLPALLLIALPGVAVALSCRPPNSGQELNAHIDKDRAVVVVAGTLLPPDHRPTRKGEATVTIGYALEGKRLMPHGPDQPFSAEISYQSGCAGAWCGPLPDKPTEGLFILRERGASWYLLVTGPCPWGHYEAQGAEQLDALRRCLAAGRCGAAELETLRWRSP